MRRPNVLILYTDQQRWDALGASGNPEILTPNLDRLAAEGTLFHHHFVQNPVCMPSRASFLTGQYPETLGITHMGVPVPEEAVTLPRLLRPYGYHTANIGKLHFQPHANRDHRQPYPDYGFDHLEIADEPGPYEDAYRAWVRQKAPDQLDAISVGLPPAATIWRQTMGIIDPVRHPDVRFAKRATPFRAAAELSFSAFVAEQTQEFITQHRNQPWLCIAGFYAPHSPWVVPQRFLDLYDPTTLTVPSRTVRSGAFMSGMNRDSEDQAGDDEVRSAIHGYYAMVTEVDNSVGQILLRLDELGLTDSTLIIFTSDHGEWLGKYGRYGKGFPADDSISRVPLIMRSPDGTAPRGQRVESIVEAIDVLPTILDYAAIQPPTHLQGTSLRPLVRGEHDLRRRELALTEHHGWKTLRTSHFRYLIQQDGREMLFDLSNDPQELTNVAGDEVYGSALAEHRRLLLTKLLERERPLPRTWTY